NNILKYVNIASVILVVIDSQEKVIFINKKGCEILGYTEDEIIGKNWFDNFIPKDIKDKVKSTFRTLMSEKVEPVKYFENPILTKDGTEKIIAWYNTILKNEKGEIYATLSSGEDITERKNVENALHHRLKIEKLIASISTNFINLSPDEIDNGINSALKKIGEFSGVDRTYIFQFSPDKTKISNTYEWCAEGIEPQKENLQNLPAEKFKWWMNKLNKLENIYIQEVENLPPEAENEKEILQAQNIRSLIVVPMVHSGSLIGFLGFDSVKKIKKWPDADIKLIRMLGEIFVNAIIQKEKEKKLMESEKKYREFVENSPNPIFSVDKNGTILTWNRACKEIFKYDENEIIGEKYHKLLINQEDASYFDKILNIVFQNCCLKDVDISFRCKDGTKKFMISRIYPFYNDKGKVHGSVFANTDITERKETERKLQESEKRYKMLLNAITSYVYTVYIEDGKPVKTYHGPRCVGVTGYTSEEYEANPFLWINMVDERDRELVRKQAEQVVNGKIVQRLEHRIIHKNGTIRWVRNTIVPHYNENGEMISYDGIIEDITDQKLAEEALRESEEKYRHLIQNSNDAIFLFYNNKFEIINSKFKEMFGVSDEEINKPEFDFMSFITSENRSKIKEKFQCIMNGDKFEPKFEFTISSRHGKKIEIEASVSQIKYKNGFAIQGILRDITERKKIEEELLKAKKLESLGILAGGIAHDFNNILTAILGNISLAKLYVSSNEKVHKLLSKAEKASIRAQDLTKQLLTFSKGGAPIKKTANIVELIKDSASFALRGSNVKCNFSIPQNLWTADIDEGQISQVIYNLVINANQAMPNGGTINIKVENTILNNEYPLPLKEGKYIKISVEDNGIGIPEEHLQKIFDPYFTTKEKGSGLGLATCYSIIKRHGGLITVESKPGIGTIFYIYLPASQKEVSEKKSVEKKPLKGNGRILIMDDDEIVRNVIGSMLKHIGYDIEFAKDGNEAIELYKNAKNSGVPFNAVIMDLTIPGGMGGKEAIKKLIKIDPDVKAIVSSGYSNDPIMSSFKEYGFCGVITKPFKIEELNNILNEIIS
ncbi:hypothetical protein DRQ09_03920, partial [candidate division KSB1 bacterium]